MVPRQFEFQPNLKTGPYSINEWIQQVFFFFFLKFEFPVMTFWTELNVGTFVYFSLIRAQLIRYYYSNRLGVFEYPLWLQYKVNDNLSGFDEIFDVGSGNI